MKKYAILIAAISALIVVSLICIFQPKENTMSDLKELAERSEQIDFNEETVIAYINNEIIILLKPDATQKEINAFVKDYGCRIKTEMADIGMYRFIFPEALSYDELQDIVNKLKKEAIIEDAYINIITELG